MTMIYGLRVSTFLGSPILLIFVRSNLIYQMLSVSMIKQYIQRTERLKNITALQSVTFHQVSNIGMRSMQELFFLTGQVEMGHFVFLMFL